MGKLLGCVIRMACIAGLCISMHGARGDEAAPEANPQAEGMQEVPLPAGKDFETLPAERFLAEIRKPMRTDAWGEFTGRITKVEKGKTMKGNLRVRITFSPSSMNTQIVLDDKNVYAFEQTHGEGGPVKASVRRPEKEVAPGLFDFGMGPDDLTFAFIYWKLVEELPRESSRLRECRVMRLADPKGDGFVNVWFNARHGFPMEAWWYKKGGDKPWRKLVLKGVKRYENGLWFVKELRLEGNGWKTQVKFEHVAKNPVGD